MTVVGAGCWIARVAPSLVLEKFLGVVRAPSDRVLLLIVVYVGVIFGGGYLIRFLTRPLIRHLHLSESPLQLSNAGMYIGWLERFLVMTALFLRSPATPGLILAAKSIARYPEFKQEQFAEYFLIGTLLSISAAIVGGVILLKTFYGSPVYPSKRSDVVTRRRVVSLPIALRGRRGRMWGLLIFLCPWHEQFGGNRTARQYL